MHTVQFWLLASPGPARALAACADGPRPGCRRAPGDIRRSEEAAGVRRGRVRRGGSARGCLGSCRVTLLLRYVACAAWSPCSLRTAHVQSARCAACAASSGPVSCGGLATPLARTCLALQAFVTIVLRMPLSVLRIRVWQYESVSLIGGCHKRLHVCSRPSSPVAAISTGGFCKQAEPL